MFETSVACFLLNHACYGLSCSKNYLFQIPFKCILMVAQLLQLTWQWARGNLSGAMKLVCLCFLNYKMAMQMWLQHRSITYTSIGFRNIHRINPSSPDTCKPITGYHNTFHYLSGAELSIATSKLLFKTWAVLHLGVPHYTLGLDSPPCQDWDVGGPHYQHQLPTVARLCRTVPVSVGMGCAGVNISSQLRFPHGGTACCFLAVFTHIYALSQHGSVVNYTPWKISIY